MIGGLGEQRRPGVRHQPLSVRPDLYLHIAPTALHPQGDLLNREPRPSDSRRIPAQPDNTAPRTPGARPVNAGSGLVETITSAASPPGGGCSVSPTMTTAACGARMTTRCCYARARLLRCCLSCSASA